MAYKISRRAFLKAVGLTAAAGLTGCGKVSPASSSASSGSAESAEHEPLTIITAKRDYTAFLDLLHASYPEINLQFEAYRGQNTSAYLKKQLETGCMPDIYTTTYAWDGALQAEHLIDLAKYPVTDAYSFMQMAQTDVDGASYLIPYDFTIQCLGYNRSLFERQGWSVPQSFAQLQELLPAIRAAGVTPAVCLLDLPGLGFQYFCSVADTVFLNTLEGRQWQQDFLAGKASAAANADLLGCADLFQDWIDTGMLNMDTPDDGPTLANKKFREGNAAFYVGTLNRYTQNTDGTGDQYALLPWLSPDGSTNAYVLQVGHYYGLSKQLEEPGKEQKLEDALHVLEVLSSPEGFASVTDSNPVLLSALSGYSVPESSPYHHVLDEINSGHLAPFLYAGWEDHTVDFGNAVRRWVAGEITGPEALAVMDATQQQILAEGSLAYGEVTEVLDTAQTAQLVGQMYLDKTGADAALISYNVWKEGVKATEENLEGVNGRMLPGSLTEADITSFLPTGWYDTIPAAAMTGARLKELAAAGYDPNHNGDPYPYLLLTRDGSIPSDTTGYRVAYAGLDADAAADASPCDTGVVGLDAAKEYFAALGFVSSASLDAALLVPNT